ncbi:hypothetical protein OH77DRAFT_1587610 [Trametes cingulata]|nr:hypothetical protein OH77DRAFT_1587610 [Trametes cingulata]
MQFVEDTREFLQLGDDTVHTVQSISPFLKLLNHLFPAYHIKRGQDYQKEILHIVEEIAEHIKPDDAKVILETFKDLEHSRRRIVDNPPLNKDECRAWKAQVKVLRETAHRSSTDAKASRIQHRVGSSVDYVESRMRTKSPCANCSMMHQSGNVPARQDSRVSLDITESDSSADSHDGGSSQS